MNWRKKEKNGVAAVTQLRSGNVHPFGALRGYVPLGTGEERIYHQMRQAIPDPAACTPEEYRKAQSRYNAIKGRNERAIQRYGTQEESPKLPMESHAVQIGDIAFATIRFELYMDFMHRLQSRSPFIQTFVIQLAGEEGGNYLATERGIANKGYSASLFCNMVGAEGGQEWVENTLQTLQKMKDQDQ